MDRLLIIRYGGFGDALQAASILPHLKGRGFHITWDTSEQGFEVLRSDRLIDALLITPAGSVPEEALPEYWNARSNGFNQVINLCESVENDSLLLPTRLGFYHDDATRRRLYGDVNYVERIHAVAGVAGPFLPRYCASDDELRAAAGSVAGAPAVVLCLAGSAEYKVWPHAGSFACRLLEATGARLFLAGGIRDAHLAQAVLSLVGDARPGDLGRVVDLTSAPIRQTLAISSLAAAVVGPETGITNAVAGFSNRKVVLLSHSSPRNLTAHWRNTVAIEPSVACHPCHRLHQTTKFCPRGPSGFAACADAVQPEDVLVHVVIALETAP
ncbi:glycosyltransferase family 9 protein [Azorhizobium doebereinerae]|uniref:glycosyltransferase family 9 protein n=1 Tax=Azorhizobium doebereinerae TaxID=281091 RepID=UPI00048D2E10|nr:hypothetical protein [Azorhizobium doebereinerae]